MARGVGDVPLSLLSRRAYTALDGQKTGLKSGVSPCNPNQVVVIISLVTSNPLTWGCTTVFGDKLLEDMYVASPSMVISVAHSIPGSLHL